MIRPLLQRILAKNKALIFQESRRMQNFLQLLMKRRNTGRKWTGEEVSQLKADLKHLSRSVPILVIFLLPFGFLLLPVLAELLDRRKKTRK